MEGWNAWRKRKGKLNELQLYSNCTQWPLGFLIIRSVSIAIIHQSMCMFVCLSLVGSEIICFMATKITRDVHYDDESLTGCSASILIEFILWERTALELYHNVWKQHPSLHNDSKLACSDRQLDWVTALLHARVYSMLAYTYTLCTIT